jgi:hypothetical protein
MSADDWLSPLDFADALARLDPHLPEQAAYTATVNGSDVVFVVNDQPTAHRLIGGLHGIRKAHPRYARENRWLGFIHTPKRGIRVSVTYYDTATPKIWKDAA